MPCVLLGRYELADVIGAGGMARVYRARDLTLDRPVAVKVLDDAAAKSADPAARDRFLNEARSAASFGHAHAVAIYDAGEDDGVLFIVMELVEGTTLAARLADERVLSIVESTSIATQILDGLSAMHESSVVHRDVKPANILLDRAGRVKLTDFGIAKRLDDIDDALTSAGMVIGTPRYLAPEQAVGGDLGPPTDVYLIGAVLHEMLTGERPPSALSGVPTHEPDPRRRRADVPAALAEVVMTALAYRAERRYATAAEMRRALEAATPAGTVPDATLRPASGGGSAAPPVPARESEREPDRDPDRVDETALMPTDTTIPATVQTAKTTTTETKTTTTTATTPAPAPGATQVMPAITEPLAPGVGTPGDRAPGDRVTGFDANGFDANGFDATGFDATGFDATGEQPATDIMATDITATEAQASGASSSEGSDGPVATVRNGNEDEGSSDGARRWGVIVSAVAAVLLVVGVALSISDGDGDGERAAAATEAAPADVADADRGAGFLARLRDDPEQFGAKGPNLRKQLDDALAEANPQRRAEKIESLRIDIFGWAAEGKIDVSVGELVEAVLDG